MKQRLNRKHALAVTYCILSVFINNVIYRVVQNADTHYFVSNFVKFAECVPIFIILSVTDSLVNLQ